MALSPPATAAAYAQYSLGLGGVSSNCEFSEDLGRPICLQGVRLIAGLDMSWDSTESKSTTNSESVSSTGKNSGNGSWLNSCNCGTPNCNGGGSGGGGLLAAAVVIFAALIVYGVWWALVSLFADDIKFGVFGSTDFQATHPERVSEYYSSYRIQRFGFRLGVYLIPGSDFQIHTHIATTSARIESEHEDVNEAAKIHGTSSAVGLGWVPHAADRGFHAYFEFSQNFTNKNSFRAYQQNQTKNPIGQSQNMSAFVIGYSL